VATIYNISDFLFRDKRGRKPMQEKRFLSSEEVAHRLGVSVRTVVTWAGQYDDSGGSEGLPAYRFGKRAWSFDKEEIERWIAKRKAGLDLATG
jgi:excisionase family DNA binding protein